MTPIDFLIVGAMLALKHFLVDGPMQTAYQYANKGNWKHPGGYLHAGLHALGTFIAFLCIVENSWAGVIILYSFAFFDFVVHYVIDWSKVNLTKKYSWSEMQYQMATTHDAKSDELKLVQIPKGLLITDNNYFIALMADQCLHFLTYILLIYAYLIYGTH